MYGLRILCSRTLIQKELGSYWNGREYDGFPVESIAVTSNDYPVAEVYDDYETVKEHFDSSQRSIKADPTLTSLQEEWQFLMKHADRRPGMIIFRKQACLDDNCECFKSPIKAKEPFEKLIQNEKYLFPTITPDPDHPGHYMTYDQLMGAREHSTAGVYFDTWSAFGSCKSCNMSFLQLKMLHATKLKFMVGNVHMIHNGCRRRRTRIHMSFV